MQNIEFKSNTEKKIPAQCVKALYENAGWWPERTCVDIEKVLDRGLAIGAWENDELVGFARVVTDGIFRAYIEDVVVHQRMQKNGVGQQMVDRLLQWIPDIDVVSLFCEEGLVSFYQRQNFKPTKQVVLHRKKSVE